MRAYLTIAALLVAIIFGGAAWIQTERLQGAREDASRYRAEAEQARLARDVLDAHLQRADAERADLQTTIDKLSTLEGADADLSAYERAVLDRLLGK